MKQQSFQTSTRPSLSDEPKGTRVPTQDYEIVVVNYRTRRHLERLLTCIPEDVWVTVTDNSARTEPVGDLVLARSHSRYLAMIGNVGFAAAANHGALQTSSEVIIFVNPDCYPDPAVLQELAMELYADPQTSSCAPSVVDEDGAPQYGGGGWLPTAWRAAAHALGLHKLFPYSGIAISARSAETLEVQWLAGTCLAVKRDPFVEAGGFDERFFLYNEDMGLGRRLHELGFHQRLRGDLKVPHIGGAAGASDRRGLWRMRAGSMVEYLNAYHPPVEAFLIRSALLTGYFVRMVGYQLAGKRHRVREMTEYARVTVFPKLAMGALRPFEAHDS